MFNLAQLSGRPRIAGILWGLCSAVVILILWTQPPFTGFLERLELLLYDIRLRYADSTIPPPHTRIAVVTANTADEKTFGGMPWNRSLYAELIRVLSAAGAKAIVMDIYFPDARDPGGDTALAQAMAQAGSVFLPEFTPQIKSVHGAGPDGVFRGRLVHNYAPFDSAACATGHVNVMTDLDGIVRRLPARVGASGSDRVRFPVTLLAALKASGVAAPPEVSPSGDLRAGALRIPLDERGCVPIRYPHFERDVHLHDANAPPWVNEAGRAKPITLYSFTEVVMAGRGKDPARILPQLRDKIVVVGVTLQGSEQDVQTTPMGRQFGVLVQAGVLHSILAKQFVRIPRLATTWLCLFPLSILLGYLAFTVHIRGSYYALIGSRSVVLLIALTALGYGSALLFTHSGIMVHMAPFALAFVLNTGANLVVDKVRAQRTADQKGGQVSLLARIGQAASGEGRTEGPLHSLEGIEGSILSVSSAIHGRTVAERILDPLAFLMPAEGYLIFAQEIGHDALRVQGKTGFGSGLTYQTVLPLADRLNAILQERRSPLLVVDAERDPTVDVPIPGLRCLMAVPVLLQDQLIGALHLYNKRPQPGPGGATFTQEDLLLVEATAHQTSVAMDNERLYLQMHGIFIDYIRSMASAIDARDHYTQRHSQRVAQFSVGIAEGMDLTPADVEVVQLAATVHDVGKIGVPEQVLNKPGKLTDDEFDLIKTHPEQGTHIVSQMADLRFLVPGIQHHHERYDGKGYPGGLAGGDIPLIARIIGVADAYDAMTSDRIYRPGMPIDKARDEILDGTGGQFDPSAAEAFLDYIVSQPSSKDGQGDDEAAET